MNNKEIKPNGQYQGKEYLVIEEILKKYDLAENEDKDFDKFLLNPIKNEKLILDSPSYKLSSLIKKYIDNELSLKDVPAVLKDECKIPEGKAEKITKELNEKIFRFIKPTDKEPAVEEITDEQEAKKPLAKDSYRESIE